MELLICRSALLLYVTSDVMSLVEENIDLVLDPSAYLTFWALDQASARTADFGILFESIASLALLICLVELGISFLFCSTGAHASHTILCWAAVGLSVVLTALAIACFGEITSFHSYYYNKVNEEANNGSLYIPDYDFYPPFNIDYSKWNTSIKLSVSFDIIEWGAAIVIVVLGSFVIYKIRDRTSLRSVRVLSNRFFPC
jgi:hypothetical protein